MPIEEAKALEILNQLIAKPETKSEDVPRIWGEIIAVYNQTFAPPPVEVKKKRRRPSNPNIGWPQGVTRTEYGAWKAAQQAKGVVENLNPQEYRRQRDQGLLELQVEAKPEPAASRKQVGGPAVRKGQVPGKKGKASIGVK